MSTTEAGEAEDQIPRCDTCGQIWRQKNMTQAELAEDKIRQEQRWAEVEARMEARIARMRAEGKIPPAKAG
jgi:hypothetical protein